MNTSSGTFRGILVGLFLVPWTVLWGSWCVLAGTLKLTRVFTFGLRVWARGILALAGIRIAARRLGGCDPAQRCVFLCNHQSALDIPVLLCACAAAQHVRFMAKESLFKVPFMGWGMSRGGFIPIRRENARQAAEVFKQVVAGKDKLPYSYVIFPEGTRSPDGRLQPLKKGTIALALRLGLPIVPVTLVDACHANPKGSYKIRPGRIGVVFHAPIVAAAAATAHTSRGQRNALLQQISSAIASALPGDQLPATTDPAAGANAGISATATSPRQDVRNEETAHGED